MPTTMKVPPSPSQRQPTHNPSQARNKGANRISSGKRSLVGWNPSPTAKRRIKPAIANAENLASHIIPAMKQLDVVRDSFIHQLTHCFCVRKAIFKPTTAPATPATVPTSPTILPSHSAHSANRKPNTNAPTSNTPNDAATDAPNA